jgi:heat-inducible transcriptional repressor
VPDARRPPELNYRSRKILYAAITEYVSTGEPVGSRKLTRKYGLNLSPATVRNVLADLEEAGYLAQPHTSAGRVPTDAGFRVFIDALVQMRDVTSEDKAAILSRMQGLEPGRDDIIREAGRLLSTLTGAAAVVTTPRPNQDKLAQLRFLPLREGVALAVLVTGSGAVQNRVVPVGEGLGPQELERVNNYLAELVDGRSLAEIREGLAREMDDERGQYAVLRERARRVVEATTQSAENRSDVVIEGQGRLFDRPEFSDVEKLRGYLRAFEEKERLLAMLDRTLAAGGVHVLVGSEANLADVQDVSVISASYGQLGSVAGALGVIGPTRMDYAKVVPLVGFTAQCISELLSGTSQDDEAS